MTCCDVVVNRSYRIKKGKSTLWSHLKAKSEWENEIFEKELENNTKKLSPNSTPFNSLLNPLALITAFPNSVDPD